MDIIGKIKVINPEQQVSATFRKREIVVTTDETYPQHILVEFSQDRVDLIDPYRVGESVIVSINISGREWVSPQGETKYFNTIRGWKIERIGASQPQSAPAYEPAPAFKEEDHDDLPF